MDHQTDLSLLGEPDLQAVDRVWRRFQRTRGARNRARRVTLVLSLAAAAGASVIGWAAWPEGVRTAELTAASTPEDCVWSDEIALRVLGRGVMTGTARDAEIVWESGTVRAEVVPHSGTRLTVVTEEARVDVVGTVFTVRRDPLGSTVGVDRGRVVVSCGDGWSGEVGEGDASHTCLPTSGAGLLGRAEALLDARAPADVVLDTLDRGVDIADGPVAGELLVLRMRQRAELGRVDDALADATRYGGTPGASRTAEVGRFAGWLALSERGCGVAMPWLVSLHQSGSAEETVLLAECVAAEDPTRATTLLVTALPALDAEWSGRAMRDLSALSGATP